MRHFINRNCDTRMLRGCHTSKKYVVKKALTTGRQCNSNLYSEYIITAKDSSASSESVETMIAGLRLYQRLIRDTKNMLFFIYFKTVSFVYLQFIVTIIFIVEINVFSVLLNFFCCTVPFKKHIEQKKAFAGTTSIKFCQIKQNCACHSTGLISNLIYYSIVYFVCIVNKCGYV